MFGTGIEDVVQEDKADLKVEIPARASDVEKDKKGDEHKTSTHAEKPDSIEQYLQ